jgi:N-acetylneuraminic acid mutarotase
MNAKRVKSQKTGRVGLKCRFTNPATHRLIMFGGYDGTTPYLNDTWAYGSATNTWTELNPGGSVPSARVVSAMVYDSLDGRVILFGGWDGTAGTAGLDDTWAFTPTR